jgi:hypothetical protein
MVIHCADPIQQESSGKVSNPVINPYHILQVRIDATLSEIRENYMRLSLLHHPGRQAPNDAEIQRRARVFKLLAACYEFTIKIIIMHYSGSTLLPRSIIISPLYEKEKYMSVESE